VLELGDQHLTADELDQLAGMPGPAGFGANQPVLPHPSASRHLSQCLECRRRLEDRIAANRRLTQLKTSVFEARGDSCPTDEQWMRVAAGIENNEVSKQMLDHAADCDHCGSLLRQSLADFSNDMTSDENNLLAGLDSARPEWQRALVQRLTATPRSMSAAATQHPTPAKTNQAWRRWLLPAAAMVLFGVAASWIFVNQRSTPESLLGRAYAAQRTLELRIAGAPYGPIRVERGIGGSRLNRPSELLEAESIIAKNLRLNPNDPRWLHAKGQADLMDGNYQSALSTLDQAHRLSPNDYAVSLDLATSYFETAEAGDSPEGYSRAINLFREVTVKDPKNGVAWFNLAVSCERVHYYTEALQAWESYLRTDPRSAWANEARSRREEILKRINQYQNERQFVDDPAAFLRSMRSETGGLTHQLSQPVEVYLDFAESSWLSKLVAQSPSANSRSQTEEALRILSEILTVEHRDPWLKNLIRNSQDSSSFRSGIASLSTAILLSKAGDYARAKVAAIEAEHSFHRSHSVPGLLRARFEEVYATHLSQQGNVCYSAAENLKRNLARTSYVWLDIQTNLEAAICANMTGRMKEAKQNASYALQLAKLTKYNSLYLRAAMELAVLDWTTGDFANATNLANAGIEEFWSAPFPRMRGYSLYSVLDSVAEDSELWFADVTIDREATRLLEGDPDHALLGFEFQRLANAAVHSGELGVAQDYFYRSAEQFAQSPADKTVEIYKAASQIGLARLDYLQGNFASSREHLRDAEPRVEESSNRFLALDYLVTQGDTFSAIGERDAALKSFLRAVEIAEKGLNSLGPERDRLIWTREYARTYRSIVKLELISKPFQGFQWWEWYKGAPLRKPQDHGANQNNPDVSSHPITSVPELPTPGHAPSDNDVTLSYVLFSDEAGVWVHDAAGTRYQQISAPRAQLIELARRFSEQCADLHSNQNQLAVDSRQLYDLLIKPLVPYISSRRIIVEADGILEAVPFEALTNEKGEFFGDEYQLANSPGMAYLSLVRPALTVADIHNSLVVASTNSFLGKDITLAPLPSATEEAQDLERILPHSHLLSSPRADETVLLQAIRDADLFHFTGHAIPTSEGSVLVLQAKNPGETPDGMDALWLQKADLKRTRLVVLSACSTAGANDVTFSGASNLARAFLTHGVPQVIATRWSLDSVAARQLMNLFYSNFLSGSPAEEALRQAREEFRKKDGYSHPYYWAAFSVFGKP
jgi:CHAT domain-containing protein